MATNSRDRRLTRSTDDRLVASVPAGVAEFLGVDATLVRPASCCSRSLEAPAGFVLYPAMWLLIPPADENQPVGLGEVREAAQGLAEDLRTRGRGPDADGEAGDVPPPAED